uniref:Uncharacterized protein n=1 Tax=Romanomermis culicivorax TaxID=13658 RepID=A0A915JJ79_ROMCU
MHLAQGSLNFGDNYISNILFPAQSPPLHFFLKLSFTLIFFGLLSVSVYFCAKCRKGKKEAANREKPVAPEKAIASTAAGKAAATQSGTAAVGAVKIEPTAPPPLANKAPPPHGDKAPPTETLLVKRDGMKNANMKSGTAAADAPKLEFKKATATPKVIPLYMETLPETETAAVVKKSTRTAPQKQTPQYVESNDLDAVKAAAAVPAAGAPAYIEVGPKDATPGQPHYIAESEIPKFTKTSKN